MSSTDRAAKTRRPTADHDGASSRALLSRVPAAVEEYAIFSLDRSGAVQTWNLGAHRIKGDHEHEILGRHFSVFYLPEDRQAGLANDALRHASSHVTRDETNRRIAKERNGELDVLIERERIATALSETMVRDIFSATIGPRTHVGGGSGGPAPDPSA